MYVMVQELEGQSYNHRNSPKIISEGIRYCTFGPLQSVTACAWTQFPPLRSNSQSFTGLVNCGDSAISSAVSLGITDCDTSRQTRQRGRTSLINAHPQYSKQHARQTAFHRVKYKGLKK